MSDSVERTIRGLVPGPPPVHWRLDAPSAAPADLPLLLALHGWGQDEDVFARLLRPLDVPPLRILLPRAPGQGGEGGASWYDYDGDQPRFRAALERCESTLLATLDAVERDAALRPRRRWLLGFSQGGYCGAWLALRHPERFAGMVIVGARVKTEWLAEDAARAAGMGFRALLCHGVRDTAVPVDAAERSRDALASAGLRVELHHFDGGHSLGRRPLRHVADWLVAAAEDLDTRPGIG